MKTHFYGTPRQEIGQELDGGTLIITVSDARLGVLWARAWD